jgi:hypothetical protein
METVLRDVRFGLRMPLKNPGVRERPDNPPGCRRWAGSHYACGQRWRIVWRTNKSNEIHQAQPLPSLCHLLSP